MARHLHIEGMDLSGKTSLVANYIERSDSEWHVKHGILNEDNPIRSLADQLTSSGRYSQEVIDELYITGIAADIETYVRPELDTIQDSVIALRALAWHVVNGNKNTADKIEALLIRHPQFDRSLYLTANMQRRQERLAIRERENPTKVNSKDLLVREDPERFARMEKILQRYVVDLFDAHIIDTSDLTPTEVLSHVEEKLEDI